ncbi:MAG: leucine-rich repeat protein [Muribaculaceae bacterium]|nr:leucine-rich repeat protein [Muribaculaceae bacterium]
MKKLITFFSLSFLVFLIPVATFAQVGGEFETEYGRYEIINETPKQVCLRYIDIEWFESQGITNLDVPSTTTFDGDEYTLVALGDWSLGNLPSLESLTIPETIEKVGDNVFGFDLSLKTININAKIPPVCTDISFNEFFPGQCKLYVPEESLRLYTSDEYWKQFFFPQDMGSLDFEYGGVYYTVLNESKKLCKTKDGRMDLNPYTYEVMAYNTINDIKGELVIPSKVYKNGEEYTVTLIGEASFTGNNITSLELPETITEIGTFAFYQCEELKSVKYPSSLIIIHENAFRNCYSLLSLDLPNSINNIKDNAFQGCKELKSVKLPNSLKILCNYVFGDCYSLEDIKLPDTLELLGSQEGGGAGHCFTNCTNLKSIILPNSLRYIGWSVFEGCTSLVSIVIPESVTSIMYSAFNGCSSLVAIKLPNTITYLQNWTFGHCTSLETIELPNSLRGMDAAFEGCTNLSTIILPSSLQEMGSSFEGCNSISEVFSYAVTPPDCWNGNAFKGAYLSIATLHVPVGTANSYASTSVWQNFGEIIDDLPSVSGNEEIFTNGDFKYKVLDKNAKTVALTGLGNTKDIEGILIVPSNVSYLNDTYTVVSIEDYAFYGLNMSIIEIPSSISNIGNWALANCNNLTNVKLPDSVLEISSGLLSGCSSLEKVYFSNSVNYIGASAFSDCINLRSLIIPDGIIEIPASMLQGCTSISEILIPNSVSLIGNSAFSGCTSLKNIDLGTGLYSIGNYAFADCPNIQNIHSMALNPPNAEAYTFPNEAYTNATVTVQEQALTTYNSQNPWYRFQNYLTVSGAISLSHYNVDMAGNEVFQLGVYGSDSKIEWSSSNPSVAYANDCGLIVAMGITGTTVITANVDGENINCNVTVSSPYRDPNLNTRAEEDNDTQPVDVIIESISGNPPIINARLVPVGSKTIIDWTSSDNNIASVENGIVTIYSDGDVDFGVETENGLEETIEIDTKNIDEAGVETIFGDSDVMMPMNVYDLSGRIIYFNATLEQIKNLDKGLYIIKGKKLLVK